MMIHEVTEQAGANKRRKRVGRGPGSGTGKTCGRGHKGARSRSGFARKAGHEGGQMPLFRRIPKRGFTNARFRKEFAVVNLKALEANFDAGAEVNPEMLAKVGLIGEATKPLKVLGEGELTKPLNVTATAFSASAREKIEKAGGSANQA